MLFMVFLINCLSAVAAFYISNSKVVAMTSIPAKRGSVVIAWGLLLLSLLLSFQLYSWSLAIAYWLAWLTVSCLPFIAIYAVQFRKN